MRLSLPVMAMALCLPQAAWAQIVSGPYVSLGGGVDFQQNEIVRAPLGTSFDPTDIYPFSATVHPPNFALQSKYAYRFSPGASAQGSVGFGFGNGLRVEIEGDFLNTHVSGVAGAPYPAQGGGHEEKFGGMVNVLYDFDVGLPVFPYVGLGAGGQAVDYRDVNASFIGQLPPGPPVYGDVTHLARDGRSGGFAYQGIAGVAVPLPFVPGLSFTTEYRFLGLLDPMPAVPGYALERFFVEYPPPIPLVGPATVRVSTERRFSNNFNHSILIGLRYAFGAPPPPAPPMPAPSATAVPAPLPARTYLVFFDWDRADLSARARAIVAEAASASTHVQTTRITVNGYTDLSGTAAYNRRLSVRRAQAVRLELLHDGVPDSAIAIHGFGESNPLVPTAQGVREPQNRRVEIILA